MTTEFAEAIIDWRDTNGTSSINYSDAGYTAKHAAFETVGELRLVYGCTVDLLAGADINRNGVLDSDEENTGLNSQTPFGMLEHFTVYNREPDTFRDVTDPERLKRTLEKYIIRRPGRPDLGPCRRLYLYAFPEYVRVVVRMFLPAEHGYHLAADRPLEPGGRRGPPVPPSGDSRSHPRARISRRCIRRCRRAR